MIRGRNIICVASGWGADPTGKHHIMRALARENRVLWVNHHGSRVPRLSRRDVRHALRTLGSVAGGTREAHPGITTLTPLVLPLPGSRAARAVNRALVVRQIRRAMRGWESRPVQLWSFAPDVAWLAGRFGEERRVYCCVDEFSAFEGYDAALTRQLEREMMARSDVVLATSRALYEARRGVHPCVHLVRHGVDDAHFGAALREGPVPADVAGLGRPIVGFFGLIHDWLDAELVAAAARLRPGWSFVLLGEVQRDVGALRACANVHLIGRREYAALPEYCRAFDVAMIPFVVNELTRNVNPIKLREYLAAGRAVVSTPLPEAARYAPQVVTAGTAQEFVAACERAMAEDSPAQRAERAAAVAEEGWGRRVEEISTASRRAPINHARWRGRCSDAGAGDLTSRFGATNRPGHSRFPFSVSQRDDTIGVDRICSTEFTGARMALRGRDRDTGNAAGDGRKCRWCGYDIRGLGLQRKCPECGLPVAISVNGPFHDAPAVWLRWMRRTLLLFHIAWIASVVALPVSAIPHTHVFPVLVSVLRVYCLWRVTRPDGQQRDRRSGTLVRLFGLVDVGVHLLVLGVWYPTVREEWYLVLAVLAYFSLMLMHGCLLPYYWSSREWRLIGPAVVIHRCGPIFALLTVAMVYFADQLPNGPVGALLFLFLGMLPIFALGGAVQTSIDFDKQLRAALRRAGTLPWLDST